MKNEYTKPILEIIDFGENDIVTNSGPEDNDTNDLWSTDASDIK